MSEHTPSYDSLVLESYLVYFTGFGRLEVV
jgi:hypothetical protein